jgi:hypothetical protein
MMVTLGSRPSIVRVLSLGIVRKLLRTFRYIQRICRCEITREEEITTDKEMHDKRAFEDQRGTRCLGLQLNIVYFCIRGNLCHQ